MPTVPETPTGVYLRRPGPSPEERCREAYAPHREALREGLARWFVECRAVPRERRAAIWRRMSKRFGPAVMADLRQRIDRQRGGNDALPPS